MKKLVQMTLPLVILIFLISCGKSVEPKATPLPVAVPDPVPEAEIQPTEQPTVDEITQNEEVAADGSNIDGFYAADLIPMNVNLHFMNVGMAGVERVEDTFNAYVRLKYAPKGDVEHRQAIYTGRRCPNIHDDLNKDAYIDIKEALVALGQITIPLDDNLETQDLGKNQYPIGDINTGRYFYQRSASFSRMFSDLKDIDQAPEDNIIKLNPEEGLTFPGRVVMIQGTNTKKELPKTVASIGSEPSHKTLPIACGVLWKVKSQPVELTPEGQ